MCSRWYSLVSIFDYKTNAAVTPLYCNFGYPCTTSMYEYGFLPSPQSPSSTQPVTPPFLSPSSASRSNSSVARAAARTDATLPAGERSASRLGRPRDGALARTWAATTLCRLDLDRVLIKARSRSKVSVRGESAVRSTYSSQPTMGGVSAYLRRPIGIISTGARV